MESNESLMIKSWIICYQCGKLYESITNSEQEEVSLRIPCLGSCLHSICILCLSSLEAPNCPICDRKDAFIDIITNKSAQQDFETIRKVFEGDQGTLLAHNLENLECSDCGSNHLNLQLCKSHLQSNITGGWILSPAISQLSFSCLRCVEGKSDCPKHEFIKIADIENIEDILQLNTILSVMNITKTYDQVSIEYFENAVNLIPSIEKMCEMIKKSERCSGTITKSQMEMKNSKQEYTNLLKRGLVFYKDQLSLFVNSYENRRNEFEEPEAKCRHQAYYEKLKAMHKKLKNTSENWLTAEEIEEIDSEIERRMIRLKNDYKSRSPIKVEEVDGYFKYRAVIKELKEAQEANEMSKKEWEESRKELEKYSEKVLLFKESLKKSVDILERDSELFTESQLDDRIYYIETFRGILSTDRAAENITVHRKALECQVASNRRQYVELMILKYFSLPMEPLPLNYFEYIREFKHKNNIS